MPYFPLAWWGWSNAQAKAAAAGTTTVAGGTPYKPLPVPRHDWTAYDDMEGVTLQSTRNPGSMRDYVASALRRKRTLEERSTSNAVYQVWKQEWIVPDELIQWPLKPGDLVIDGVQNRWTVITAEPFAMDSEWRLDTLALLLHPDLYDVIDIERASVFQDAGGSTYKVYPGDAGSGGSVLYKALPCRVQLIEGPAHAERGIRGQVRKFQVISSLQIDDVTTEDRAKWIDPSGRTVYLEIRNLRNPERVDELPVLDCEQTL